MGGSLETLTSAGAMVERLVGLVDDADDELAVALPPGVFDAVRKPLARAFDDGALVLALASGVDPVPATELEDCATLARRREGHAPLTCTVDGEAGLFAPAPFVAGERTDRPATAFEDPGLAQALFDGFVGNYWLSGTEVHAADPAPFGRPYTTFRHALVQATLHLREREPLRAQVVGRPATGADTETVEGAVVNARQCFVSPVTHTVPAGTSIGLDVDGNLVSVGGWGAFDEDYEAELVTLKPP